MCVCARWVCALISLPQGKEASPHTLLHRHFCALGVVQQRPSRETSISLLSREREREAKREDKKGRGSHQEKWSREMKPTTTQRPRVVTVERIRPIVKATTAATTALLATVTAALIRSWIIPMRRSVQVQELASAAIVRLLQAAARRCHPNCRPCPSFPWRWRLPLGANLSSKSASSRRLTIWKRQSPSVWKCPKKGYASYGRIGKIFALMMMSSPWNG